MITDEQFAFLSKEICDGSDYERFHAYQTLYAEIRSLQKENGTLRSAKEEAERLAFENREAYEKLRHRQLDGD